MDIETYLDKFKDKKILVIGDLMVDEYMWGKARKISQEAPVPVINIENNEWRLGGTGNVINNIVSLGGSVIAVGVVGNDTEGDWIIETLKSKSVDVSCVVKDCSRSTITKTRVISNGQQIVRIDREKIEDIEPQLVKKISEYIFGFDCVENVDAVLISDYGKGTLSRELIRSVISWSNNIEIPVVVDPKGKDFSKYQGASVITPNRDEITLACGIGNLDDIGYSIVDDLDLSCGLIITMGKDGMIVVTEDNSQSISTNAKTVCDVSGAGDTVVSVLTLCLTCDDDLLEAAKLSNIAAGISVGKLGTATVSKDEILEFVNHSNKKLKSINDIMNMKNKGDFKNKKVVFTNGCFDILHTGHIKILESAKSFGDVLIVGLNSDTSVKKLKGMNRPIVNQDDRAKILSSLEFVDYIILFDEDTPENIISRIIPDFLVKGKEYEDKDISGSDIVKNNGGSVILINRVENKSTTNIIDMCRGCND